MARGLSVRTPAPSFVNVTGPPEELMILYRPESMFRMLVAPPRSTVACPANRRAPMVKGLGEELTKAPSPETPDPLTLKNGLSFACPFSSNDAPDDTCAVAKAGDPGESVFAVINATRPPKTRRP